MNQKSKIHIRKLKWEDARPLVHGVDQSVVTPLDEVATLLDTPFLYELEIPFGTELMDNGSSLIHTEEFLKAASFSELSGHERSQLVTEFREQFDYDGDHPLALILEGVVEIFSRNRYKRDREEAYYRYPLNRMGSGDFVGVFGMLDGAYNGTSSYSYSVIAGATCMVPFLPTPMKGSKSYQKTINGIATQVGIRELEDNYESLNQVLTLWAGRRINRNTRLLLFPRFWYNGVERKDLILHCMPVAWEESQQFRHQVLRSNDIAMRIAKKALSNKHQWVSVHSNILYTLQQIVVGKGYVLSPILPADPYYGEFLDEIRELISAENFEPVIFQFLRPGSGAPEFFPVTNLPFQITGLSLSHELELIRDLQEVFRLSNMRLSSIEHLFTPDRFYADSNYKGQIAPTPLETNTHDKNTYIQSLFQGKSYLKTCPPARFLWRLSDN